MTYENYIYIFISIKKSENDQSENDFQMHFMMLFYFALVPDFCENKTNFYKKKKNHKKMIII